MPAFLVVAPAESGQSLKKGADRIVVFATDATAAKEMAKAAFDGESDALWAAATATTIAEATDFTGWTFRLRLYPATASEPPAPEFDVTHVGTAQTVDQVMASLVTALNNTALNAASYDGTGNVLTVAGAADSKGDRKLVAEAFPPGCERPLASGFWGSITDGGAAGAAVTVAVPADAYVKPALYAALKSA
jgi:hypothetical protein